GHPVNIEEDSSASLRVTYDKDICLERQFGIQPLTKVLGRAVCLFLRQIPWKFALYPENVEVKPA
ncbi:hypothetical protein ABTB07_22550, partial [Acinetobacter baumannii]